MPCDAVIANRLFGYPKIPHLRWVLRTSLTSQSLRVEGPSKDSPPPVGTKDITGPGGIDDAFKSPVLAKLRRVFWRHGSYPAPGDDAIQPDIRSPEDSLLPRSSAYINPPLDRPPCIKVGKVPEDTFCSHLHRGRPGFRWYQRMPSVFLNPPHSEGY